MALLDYQLRVAQPLASSTKAGIIPVEAFLVTTEAPAAVEAANYFNGAAKRLPKGSVINAVMSHGGTPVRYWYVVTSNDGTTVVVAKTTTEVVGDQVVAALTFVTLVDNSGGVAADVIVDVPGAYAEATLAAQIASMVRAINRLGADNAALRAALLAAGLTTT
jgi:pyruvoyl-dependent arginine decarboxylase (PvlArgDC)